jgi:hypothetical protein
MQANMRKRILRAFVARGHIEAHDAKDMAAYAHGGGFSVDAGVLIEATDCAGLERLLRYCARPPPSPWIGSSNMALIWFAAVAKATARPPAVREILG